MSQFDNLILAVKENQDDLGIVFTKDHELFASNVYQTCMLGQRDGRTRASCSQADAGFGKTICLYLGLAAACLEKNSQALIASPTISIRNQTIIECEKLNDIFLSVYGRVPSNGSVISHRGYCDLNKITKMANSENKEKKDFAKFALNFIETNTNEIGVEIADLIIAAKQEFIAIPSGFHPSEIEGGDQDVKNANNIARQCDIVHTTIQYMLIYSSNSFANNSKNFGMDRLDFIAIDEAHLVPEISQNILDGRVCFHDIKKIFKAMKLLDMKLFGDAIDLITKIEDTFINYGDTHIYPNSDQIGNNHYIVFNGSSTVENNNVTDGRELFTKTGKQLVELVDIIDGRIIKRFEKQPGYERLIWNLKEISEVITNCLELVDDETQSFEQELFKSLVLADFSSQHPAIIRISGHAGRMVSRIFWNRYDRDTKELTRRPIQSLILCSGTLDAPDTNPRDRDFGSFLSEIGVGAKNSKVAPFHDQNLSSKIFLKKGKEKLIQIYTPLGPNPIEKCTNDVIEQLDEYKVSKEWREYAIDVAISFIKKLDVNHPQLTKLGWKGGTRTLFFCASNEDKFVFGEELKKEFGDRIIIHESGTKIPKDKWEQIPNPILLTCQKEGYNINPDVLILGRLPISPPTSKQFVKKVFNNFRPTAKKDIEHIERKQRIKEVKINLYQLISRLFRTPHKETIGVLLSLDPRFRGEQKNEHVPTINAFFSTMHMSTPRRLRISTMISYGIDADKNITKFEDVR